MAKKSRLTPEQRAQLVLQVLSKEAPVAQIARRAGISEQTLYRWRDEFMSAGKRAMNGGGGKAEQAKALARISQTHLGGVSSGADEPGCGSICVALRQSGPGLIV